MDGVGGIVQPFVIVDIDISGSWEKAGKAKVVEITWRPSHWVPLAICRAAQPVWTEPGHATCFSFQPVADLKSRAREAAVMPDSYRSGPRWGGQNWSPPVTAAPGLWAIPGSQESLGASSPTAWQHRNLVPQHWLPWTDAIYTISFHPNSSARGELPNSKLRKLVLREVKE